MPIFFFVEQKAFRGTHRTSVCIFYPKCQHRKRLSETKARGVALLSAVSVSPLLSLFWTGLFCESLHREIMSLGSGP